MGGIDESLRLVRCGDGWMLAGSASAGFALVDEYLAYLSDRNYCQRSVGSPGGRTWGIRAGGQLFSG